MDSNPLSSPIPIQLANFTSLTLLDLNNCQLHGSMPYLPQLQYLDVSVNKDLMVDLVHMFDYLWPKLQVLSITLTNVVGPVPSSISNASSLVYLLASHCSIRGSLPDSISNHSHLQYLDLSFNYLIGYIPYTISNLRNLRSLNLVQNGLHGPIPETEISSLTTLLLIGNNLNETVPSCVVKLRKLQVFEVTGNNLKGTISFKSMFQDLNPVWISFNNNLLDVQIDVQIDVSSRGSSLSVLDISKNKLSGRIPSTLKYCSSLISLNLGANCLTGNIPNELESAKNLKFLQLYENNLNGTIPTVIEQFHYLEVLSLWSNNLEGGIPHLLGTLSNLRIISLSSNMFNGSIPEEITDLHKLQFLDSCQIINCLVQFREVRKLGDANKYVEYQSRGW
ncbi:hypothetical protein MKW92_006421 [Papaver armeniacum]|nr:hypothetical protein MKW92_006421 [Papaver armeniacum]